jgi:hypothetical protein
VILTGLGSAVLAVLRVVISCMRSGERDRPAQDYSGCRVKRELR